MSALSAMNRPITLGRRAARPPRSPLVLGGVPRADLLPPSVVAERRLRHAARAVGIALITTLVIVLGAVGASFAHSFAATAALDAERERTNELLASQSEFSEVSSALGAIDRLSAARAAAGTTDIEWGPYLARVAALLPPGTTVGSVVVTAATPTTPLPAAVGASGKPLAATMLYTVTGPDLAAVRDWMLALRGLPGYAGAALQSASEADGLYSAQVQIAVDQGIYSGRFVADASTAGGGAVDGSASATSAGQDAEK